MTAEILGSVSPCLRITSVILKEGEKFELPLGNELADAGAALINAVDGGVLIALFNILHHSIFVEPIFQC